MKDTIQADGRVVFKEFVRIDSAPARYIVTPVRGGCAHPAAAGRGHRHEPRQRRQYRRAFPAGRRSDSQRLIFAKYLVREAPAILDHLDQDARSELEAKLKELKRVEKDSDIRELLSALAGKLEQVNGKDAQATK
ncbi:MAG TPA: hypothetical protein VM223_07890 [Planctomycetota bacterium]|nr:hypothetical protein [Planctomycetota bacterium]